MELERQALGVQEADVLPSFLGRTSCASSTDDQISAMAYVDGELVESARREFEDRLTREPMLRHAVTEQKRILSLVNQVLVAAGRVHF
jgi:anti-sigma factor RsiW